MNSKKRLSTKERRKQQRKFLATSNILIAVVALIECLILASTTTYSWIESSSSLIIKTMDDKPMNVSENRNYKFEADADSNGIGELNTYFDSVKYFQYAKASSPDGKTFYFPKKNNVATSVATYRKGDTSDYNTSYNYIDFVIKSATNKKTYNYYFDSANIFSITPCDESISQEICNQAAKAMRISIASTSSGSTEGTTPAKIYSSEGFYTGECAIENANGGTKTFVSGDIKTFESSVQSLTSPCTPVFSSFTNSDTFVRIRIWFEMMDRNFTSLDLTDDEMNALLSSTVNVNLGFTSSENNAFAINFNDYTFSNETGHLGENVTTERDGYRVCFKYNNDYYPMCISDTLSDITLWSTCDSNGNIFPTVPGNVFENFDTSKASFVYCNYNLSTGQVTETLYTWNVKDTPVLDTQVGTYVFNALSVTQNNVSYFKGFGKWSNDTPELLYFKDLTTASLGNTDFNYGEGSISFINGKRYSLYVNDKSAFNNSDAELTSTFYYDADNNIWKTYVPSSWIKNEQLHFRYCISNSTATRYTDCRIHWDESNVTPQTTDGKYVFTGLGYQSTSSILSLSNTSGVGTWGEAERIDLNTELVDSSVNGSYKYQITTSVNGSEKSYNMSGNSDRFTFSAYVPKDNGKEDGNIIKFKAYSGNNVIMNWNDTSSEHRESSSTYYATSFDPSAGRKGAWRVAVVSDATYENLLNPAVINPDAENPATNIQYSLDGVNYYDMLKIDDYRYYAPITGDVSTVRYRWTPYTNTQFDYTHNLADGMYYTITEGMAE